MKKILSFFFLLLVIGLFAACGNTNSSTTNDLLAKAQREVPADKAAIVGVVTHDNGTGYDNTPIRLAEIVWNAEKTEGAFFLDMAQSPGTYTLSNGAFMINNIKPGEYAMIVGDVMERNTVIREDGQDRVRVYSLTAGTVLDIGVMKVEYP